jgi:hypothetical protein
MSIHIRFGLPALLVLCAACTPLYPTHGPRRVGDGLRATADVETCRRLSGKFATSGGITKVTGPLAAAGGLTAAILGARDEKVASGAAGAFAMAMAISAAVSGILHESYTTDYIDRCTINTGGDADRTPPVAP